MKRSRNNKDALGPRRSSKAGSLASVGDAESMPRTIKRRKVVMSKARVHCMLEGDESKHLSAAQKSGSSPPAVNMSIIHGPADAMSSDDPSSPKFPYKPLDIRKLEIRLITLKPGIDSSPIECQLDHAATYNRSRPSYKALSYTWGPPMVNKTIYLNGVLIEVRENLWQALYHLRSSNTELVLWVDAICINQNNIPERNQQVTRMGTIYGSAKEVIVWLGPEEAGSGTAITFIEKTMRDREGKYPQDLSLLLVRDGSFQPILDLTRREYWKRVWIVQEIIRARRITIHCGKRTLQWSVLAKFFRRLRKSTKITHPLQDSLPRKLTEQKTSQNHHLERLLATYKSSLCSDPRDKIFSLIGLAGKRLGGSPGVASTHAAEQWEKRYNKSFVAARESWVKIDYSKSNTELFRDLVVLFYDKEPLFNGKCFMVRRMQLFQEVLALGPRRNLPGLEQCERGDTNTLPYTGARITCFGDHTGHVLEIGPVVSAGLNYETPINDWYDQIFRNQAYIEGRMSKMPSLSWGSSNFSGDDISRAQVRELPGYRKENTYLSCYEANLKPRSEKQAARLFTMDNGRMGLGPLSMTEGDKIVQFHSCDVVFAVRHYDFIVGRAMLLKADFEPPEEHWPGAADFHYVSYGVPKPLNNSDGNFETKFTLPLNVWESLTW